MYLKIYKFMEIINTLKQQVRRENRERIWKMFWSEWKKEKNTSLQKFIVAVIPRWWRTRTRRPLSFPQIHQKIIYMWGNFHKTNSECWLRAQDTQKVNPISSKSDRTEKDKRKRETKDLGADICPGLPWWLRG